MLWFTVKNKFENEITQLVEDIGEYIYTKKEYVDFGDTATWHDHDRYCEQLGKLLLLCAGELNKETLLDIELAWQKVAKRWYNWPNRKNAHPIIKEQMQWNHLGYEPFDDEKMQKFENLISLIISG